MAREQLGWQLVPRRARMALVALVGALALGVLVGCGGEEPARAPSGSERTAQQVTSPSVRATEPAAPESPPAPEPAPHLDPTPAPETPTMPEVVSPLAPLSAGDVVEYPGRVLGPGGAPVAGAQVRVVTASGPWASLLLWGAATTDDAGRFRIRVSQGRRQTGKRFWWWNRRSAAAPFQSRGQLMSLGCAWHTRSVYPWSSVVIDCLRRK